MDTDLDPLARRPPDPVKEALKRELYWAREDAPQTRLSTGELVDAIREFASRLRAEEQLFIPTGEPNLASLSRSRKAMKYRIFRFLRFMSWRYDRLVADLAELTAALANRVVAAESEVERLRSELRDREPGER